MYWQQAVFALTPFTVTGLALILQLPLFLGQTVVVMKEFEMKAMLDAIVHYKCDELWLVPRKHGRPLGAVERV
jgi:4-coumarate--CoA ligase